MNMVEESRQVLEQLIPQLEAEGYRVYLEPSRQILPSFMEGYVPDAIALGPKKKLAIEVVLEGPASQAKETNLRQRFADTKDWELRIYYVRPADRKDALEAMSKEAIDSSISSVETLISTSQASAALLIAWATFEALGRALIPGKFARPQTPGRLIEVLASEGIVTPSEADLLRKLANARNQLIHGKLNAEVSLRDLALFVEILKTVSKTAPAFA